MSLWQLVDEVVGAGGDDDDGDERRAQDAQRPGHVLKWRANNVDFFTLLFLQGFLIISLIYHSGLTPTPFDQKIMVPNLSDLPRSRRFERGRRAPCRSTS